MELWKPFANTFDAERLTIFCTEHWSVLVRKGQITLGTLVLAANRNFISVSELTRDELLELPEVVSQLEAALTKAFAYDKINYLCLMMSDRHYHSHVVPRYEGTRTFDEQDWDDTDWPGPPNIAVAPADDETLLAIRDHLKQYV